MKPLVETKAPLTQSTGFTLIEMLVVVSIITLLISMMLPALSQARSAAKQVQCASNLRSLGLAAHLYAEANRDRHVLHYQEFMTGLGNGQPSYFYGNPLALWQRGSGAILFNEGYLTSRKVFYCPDNDGHGSESAAWPGTPPGFSPTDQRLWGNYALVTGNNMFLSISVDMGVYQNIPDRTKANAREGSDIGGLLIASDYRALHTSTSPYLGNHQLRGGNTLFNGGHVRWIDDDQRASSYLWGRNINDVYRTAGWFNL